MCGRYERSSHPTAVAFGLAGLYERWLSPDGEVLDTCAIVTTSSCESLRSVHDRMPVIVPESEYARWLDLSVAGVADLVAGWSGEPLHIYPVSTRVNAVRNDDPELCHPVEGTTARNAAAGAAAAPATPAQSVHPPAHVAPAASGNDVEEALVEDEEPVQARLF